MIRPEHGTYLLVLQSTTAASLQIGNWGKLSLRPGFYLYVGSALGPGGVRARVLRHLRTRIPKHWHIDHLLSALSLIEVWTCYSPKRLEHFWARSLFQGQGISQIPGFGSSDCSCPTHLFYTKKKPDCSSTCAAMPCAVHSISCLDLSRLESG